MEKPRKMTGVPYEIRDGKLPSYRSAPTREPQRRTGPTPQDLPQCGMADDLSTTL